MCEKSVKFRYMNSSLYLIRNLKQKESISFAFLLDVEYFFLDELFNVIYTYFLLPRRFLKCAVSAAQTQGFHENQ